MSECVCTLATPTHWTVTAAIAALAVAAAWVFYGLGSAIGEWRARRAGDGGQG